MSCVCVFSRCNAAGRIYMTSKTGSYYQYPLTCVYFSVHLHACLYVCEVCAVEDSRASVYSPVNEEAKFILWPLYAMSVKTGQ